MKRSIEKQVCQNCRGTQRVRNGFVYYGKQNFKCKTCGQRFVENEQQNQISADKRKLVDKLSWAGLPTSSGCTFPASKQL
jgi:transposase-like protein